MGGEDTKDEGSGDVLRIIAGLQIGHGDLGHSCETRKLAAEACYKLILVEKGTQEDHGGSGDASDVKAEDDHTGEDMEIEDEDEDDWRDEVQIFHYAVAPIPMLVFP